MSKIVDECAGRVVSTEMGWTDAKVWSSVNALISHTRKLEAMLKKHEFSDNDYMDNFCPSCYNYEIEGHSPDCELARLIE